MFREGGGGVMFEQSWPVRIKEYNIHYFDVYEVNFHYILF